MTDMSNVPIIVEPSKTCTKCGEIKPLSEFYRQAECALGVRPTCKSCDKERSAKRRAEKPEECRALVARWHAENPERKRELDARWNANNPDKVRERSARLRLEHPERARAYARKFARKRSESVKARIEDSMRSNLRGHIKRGTKFGRRTFDILGYTLDDLVDHLERQFVGDMTWENYGRGGWHIDHIIPLASFRFETPDDAEFKLAWALSNLQPLTESENCSKRDRLDHPSTVAALAANDNRPLTAAV